MIDMILPFIICGVMKVPPPPPITEIASSQVVSREEDIRQLKAHIRLLEEQLRLRDERLEQFEAGIVKAWLAAPEVDLPQDVAQPDVPVYIIKELKKLK